MSHPTPERIRDLGERITQLAIKTKAKDHRAATLFLEMNELSKRSNKWGRAGRIIGAISGLAAFFGVESLHFTGFPNEAAVLGFVAAVMLFVASTLGFMLLGKLAMRAQIADWARRADALLREPREEPITTPKISSDTA